MMRQIIEWIGQHLWQICIFISLFIQFTPIKFNPWTAVFKWIGKIFTGKTEEKIDKLLHKIDKIDGDIDQINRDVMSNEKDRIRWEVLDFANSCRNNRKHTRDEFQHITALHDKYKYLLEKTEDKNGVFEIEYDYIQKLYAERLEKNDFL